MKRILAGALLVALCVVLCGESPVLADATAWEPITSLSGVSVTALALSPNYDSDHTVFAGLRVGDPQGVMNGVAQRERPRGATGGDGPLEVQSEAQPHLVDAARVCTGAKASSSSPSNVVMPRIRLARPDGSAKTRSPTRTPTSSCTATSSPRTSWSRRKAG